MQLQTGGGYRDDDAGSGDLFHIVRVVRTQLSDEGRAVPLVPQNGPIGSPTELVSRGNGKVVH